MSTTYDPIDAVITWVDGSDPKLQTKRSKYISIKKDDATVTESRYSDCDELLYCLTGIAENLRFIKRVFIVTDDQIPSAIERLRTRLPKSRELDICVVDHKCIFRDFEEFLPTFNSTTIESALHRIPNLSNRYIYFNDDFIAIEPLEEEFFFHGNKPVLRGYFRRSILVQKLRPLLLRKGRGNYFSYKDYQLRSAEIVGDAEQYFWHDHIPHPFYRPTLQSFFENNQDIFRTNISFRTRNYTQFDTMALSNVLHINDGNASIERNLHLLYLKPSNKKFPRIYLVRKWITLKVKRKKFLCIQTLSDCDTRVRNLIIRWLDKKFGY